MMREKPCMPHDQALSSAGKSCVGRLKAGVHEGNNLATYDIHELGGRIRARSTDGELWQATM